MGNIPRRKAPVFFCPYCGGANGDHDNNCAFLAMPDDGSIPLFLKRTEQPKKPKLPKLTA